MSSKLLSENSDNTHSYWIIIYQIYNYIKRLVWGDRAEQPNYYTMPSVYDPATIHHTCRTKTKDEIMAILKYKIDLKRSYKDGGTVIHSVLKNQKLIESDIIKILTSLQNQGINPNSKNQRDETALHLAIERRMQKVIDLLLQFKADQHVKDSRDNTLAHFFIEDEYEKCKLAILYPLMNTPENREIANSCSVNFLKFLISKKINFDLENEEGASALRLAMEFNLLHLLPTLLQHSKEKNELTLELLMDQSCSTLDISESVKVLLDERIAANKDDIKQGCTIVSEAIKQNANMKVIEAMINYYLNKCKRHSNLATALVYELVSTSWLWSSSQTDYFLTVLHDLVNYDANINNERALMELALDALSAKNLRLLTFLNDNGIGLNFRFARGCNVLHLLAKKQGYEPPVMELRHFVVNFLATSSFDVDSGDSSGKSALHTAASCGNILMAHILIELGADLNCRDKNEMTPLHDAVVNNMPVELIELLVSSGADINARNFKDETPLYLSILNNNVGISQQLIDYDASINCRDKKHRTPLHRAVMMDDAIPICKFLLKNGCDVNAKDKIGNTPLHNIFKCLTCDSDRILRLLLKKGAYPNARNNNGETPLFHALSIENVIYVEELLHYNADVNDFSVRNLVCTDCELQDFLYLKQHLNKLKVANLPLHKDYTAYVNDDYVKLFSTQYLKETQMLKVTLIDNDISMYNFLHMRPERRYEYINHEKLQEFIELQWLNEQFPNYSVIILASYHEAKVFKAKQKLSKVLTEIIFERHNVSVENVAEKIVNFLQYEDLHTVYVRLCNDVMIL